MLSDVLWLKATFSKDTVTMILERNLSLILPDLQVRPAHGSTHTYNFFLSLYVLCLWSIKKGTATVKGKILHSVSDALCLQLTYSDFSVLIEKTQ